MYIFRLLSFFSLLLWLLTEDDGDRYLTTVLHSRENANYVFGTAAVLAFISLVVVAIVADYLVSTAPPPKQTRRASPGSEDDDDDSDDDSDDDNVTADRKHS